MTACRRPRRLEPSLARVRSQSHTMVLGLVYTIMSAVLGALYPAFMSFKAIKSSKDTRKWLEYWAVYALYTVLEWSVLDNLVASLPAYYLIKLAFVAWLATKDGASYLYQNVVEKQLVQHESHIDAFLEKASKEIMTKATDAKAQGLEFAKKHAGSLVAALSAPKPGAAPTAAPDNKASGKAE